MSDAALFDRAVPRRGLARDVRPEPGRRSRRREMAHLTDHPNETWIDALRGTSEGSTALVDELAAYLRRVLRTTLRAHSFSDEAFDEITQESFSRLLSYLHTFRGDSRFSTWAAAVATRVAFGEIRRRAEVANRHVPFLTAERDATEIGSTTDDPASGETGERARMVELLYRAMETDLTEKQRVASLALLRGVPTIEIAERTGSNPNAVYKLVHDARLRLRRSLERHGVTASSITELFSDGGEA